MQLMTTSILPSLNRSPKAAPRAGITSARPVPFDRRHHFELLAVIHVVKQQRALGPGRSPVVLVGLRIDMAADKHQVFPAVVIVVEKLVCPN